MIRTFVLGSALALRSSERDVSALLAAEAYRRWPDDPRTRSGLMGVLQGAEGFLGNTIMADGGKTYGSVVPGTGDVVMVSTSGDAAVRDAETGDVVQPLDLGFVPGPPRPPPPSVRCDAVPPRGPDPETGPRARTSRCATRSPSSSPDARLPNRINA